MQRPPPASAFIPIRPAYERPDDQGDDHNSHLSPTHSAPKKKQTSIACGSCRRQKVKCDGIRPKCSKCAALDLECEYDALPGESKSSSLKRKRDEALANAGDLSELVSMLRDRPENEAAEIVRRLRSGADPRSLLKTVHDADFLIQGFASRSSSLSELSPVDIAPAERVLSNLFPQAFPTLSSTEIVTDHTPSAEAEVLRQMRLDSPEREGSSQQEKDDVTPAHPKFGTRLKETMDNSDFSDARLVGSKGSRWTRVIEDDRLIAGLMSWSLAWSQAPFILVDIDAFLHDFVSGEENFCSSALVNAMLALAAQTGAPFHFSSERRDVSQLSSSFAAEAYEELENMGYDNTRACLTIVPTLLILASVEVCNGRDKMSWSHIGHCVDLANKCDLFTDDEPTTPRYVNPNHWKTSFSVISWSLFNWATMYSFTLQKKPYLKRYPLTVLPYPDTQDRCNTDNWQPYPLVQPLQPKQFGLSFRSFCEFAIILNDISWLLYSTEASVSLSSTNTAQLCTHVTRLMEWSNNLPQEIADSVNGLPHVMLLHLIYHVAIVGALRPLVAPEKLLSFPGVGQLRPSAISTTSMHQLKALIFVYSSKYGYHVFHAMIIPPLICVCDAQVSLAGQPMNDAEARYFFLLCVGAMEMLMLRAPIVRGFQASVLLAASRMGVRLSRHLKATLAALRNEVISTDFLGFGSHSDYPIDLTGSVKDRQAARFNSDKIVEELSLLELGGL